MKGDGWRFKWERALRDDPNVTGMRFAVLFAIASTYDDKAGQADDAGRARVAQATLARWTGHAESRVREVIRWARATGYLEQAMRGHRTGDGRALASEYLLTLPQPAPDVSVEARCQPLPDVPVDPESQPLRMTVSTAPNGPLNRSLRDHPSLVSPSKVSPSSAETNMRDRTGDVTDDDAETTPLGQELRHRLTSCKLPDTHWTDDDIDHARTRITRRLGIDAPVRDILLGFVSLAVEQPNAYISSIRDDNELRAIAERAHEAYRDDGPPTLSHCGQCNPVAWIEDNDGLPIRRCPTCHPAERGATA